MPAKARDSSHNIQAERSTPTLPANAANALQKYVGLRDKEAMTGSAAYSDGVQGGQYPGEIEGMVGTAPKGIAPERRGGRCKNGPNQDGFTNCDGPTALFYMPLSAAMRAVSGGCVDRSAMKPPDRPAILRVAMARSWESIGS